MKYNQVKKVTNQFIELVSKAINKNPDEKSDYQEINSIKFKNLYENSIYIIVKQIFYRFVEKILNINIEELDDLKFFSIKETINTEEQSKNKNIKKSKQKTYKKIDNTINKIIVENKVEKSVLNIEHCNKYRSISITQENLRWYMIYVITNTVNNKKYIGQAVSHLKIRNKYKPYGSTGRLASHFREAFSKKEHQCTYLNNAIRDSGKDKFIVETLIECTKEDVDRLEIQYIKQYNSMFPEGYNIMQGGRKIEGYIEKGTSVPRKLPCLKHKLEMSQRTREYNRKKRMDQCLKYFKYNILLGFNKYICKGKDFDGYECYMLNFKKEKPAIRAIFGGQHIKLEESYNKCIEFYKELKENLAKRLDAGNSSESDSTTEL
jgi:hypothetical protein